MVPRLSGVWRLWMLPRMSGTGSHIDVRGIHTHVELFIGEVERCCPQVELVSRVTRTTAVRRYPFFVTTAIRSCRR